MSTSMIYGSDDLVPWESFSQVVVGTATHEPSGVQAVAASLWAARQFSGP
jgi:hypothetical protein